MKLKRKREAAGKQRQEQDEALVRAKVDALLAKISTEGIASLSPEEKAFLQDASKRFR